MAQPYIGEIRIFAGNFAPAGWLFCDGQLIPISENDALYTLIGTTYGGDGQETFALPDLRGRLPVHQGIGLGNISYPLAQMDGVEEITLTVNQLPSHSHPLLASSAVNTNTSPEGNVVSQSSQMSPYIHDTPQVDMELGAVIPAGGSQPHTNLQPYLCVNFIISLYGIFPQFS
jgi:microcystin-dependent protein